MDPTDPEPDAALPDWGAFYRDYRKPGYIEGFEITTKLGGGMFGQVFRARRMSIGKDYAIKFLKVDDGEVRRAVLSELEQVKYFAQIDHPNLVSIEDRGEVDGIPYLVMAFAGTETLRDLMVEDRAPTPEEKEPLVRSFLQAARGLQALHERSLVHFDIKPANIFLKGGVARLGDYGLSKLVTHSRGSLSMGRGTPYYMAPEMLQRRGDERSDVYSMGVMLYELLCGEVPFTGDSEWEVLRKHEQQAPALPAHLTPTERSVLTRCLQKDPADRYPSMAALIEALGPQDEFAPARVAVAPPLPAGRPAETVAAIGSSAPPPLPGARPDAAAQPAGGSPGGMPPLPPRRRPERRRQRIGSPVRSVLVFGALVAVILFGIYGVVGSVRMAGARSSHFDEVAAQAEAAAEAAMRAAEHVHVVDVTFREAAGRDIERLVEQRLQRGQRAARRGRPDPLQPLDVERLDPPRDFEAYRQLLRTYQGASKASMKAARSQGFEGRSALLAAVERLQELDYTHGRDCVQAANLLAFLEELSGVTGLTMSASGFDPSGREACMMVAAAQAWKDLAERYARDDQAFMQLLKANGKVRTTTIR